MSSSCTRNCRACLHAIIRAQVCVADGRWASNGLHHDAVCTGEQQRVACVDASIRLRLCSRRIQKQQGGGRQCRASHTDSLQVIDHIKIMYVHTYVLPLYVGARRWWLSERVNRQLEVFHRSVCDEKRTGYIHTYVHRPLADDAPTTNTT